jgi:hypothetical protein
LLPKNRSLSVGRRTYASGLASARLPDDGVRVKILGHTHHSYYQIACILAW